MKSNKVLFYKKNGRNVFKKILFTFISRVLAHQAQKHIVDNKKQLTVFSFDHIAHQINIDGIYAIHELGIIFNWLKKCNADIFNGSAIDVGANIGNHSLYFSNYFKKVYSFEPNPRVFKVLSLNSELAQNILCFNMGISDGDKQAILHINPTNIGGSSMSHASPLSNNNANIELTKLDSIIDESESIRLIKVDVEGHEYQVFLGSERIIRKNQPIILFEQNVDAFKDGKSQCITLLKKLGYSKFATVEFYPRPRKTCGIARDVYIIIGMLLLGESIQIVLKDDIEPDNYSCIIAIPPWINA